MNAEMPRRPLAAVDGMAFLELAGVPSFAFFGLTADFFAEELGVVAAVFDAGLPAATTHSLPSSTTMASVGPLPAFSSRDAPASTIDAIFRTGKSFAVLLLFPAIRASTNGRQNKCRTPREASQETLAT